MTYVLTFLVGWIAGVAFFSWSYQRKLKELRKRDNDH